MSIRNIPHYIETEIVEFSKRGNGLGYFDRQDGTRWPVEVPFSVPGDRVRVLLLRKKSGIYGCRLEKTIKFSKSRIEPRCLHFGVCGGCRWQHLPYRRQLREKQELIRQCFGDLLAQKVEFREIIPSPDAWHYRNKMEFTFSSDSSGSRYLGLMMDSTKGHVFHLSECHLPNSWFADAVKAVRQWWNESGLDAYHSGANTGTLRNLILREGQNTGDRMVNLKVSGNPEYAIKKRHLESFVAFIRDAIELVDPTKKLSIFLTIQQVAKGKPTNFYEMHLHGADHIREVLQVKTDPAKEPVPLTFAISPSSFFQPNTRQAEKIYSLALTMALIGKHTVVYDLYCGTGVFGICAAKRSGQVVGIELSPEAAHDARHNASINRVSNVTILTGSVKEKLQEIRSENLFPPPDLVIVDPPRSGLDPHAIEQIQELSPSKILYISCNPVTLAENVGEFIKAGYQLQVVQPIDQFPHTASVEIIALLQMPKTD